MKNNLNLYSLKERIFLVKTFYKSNCSVNSVKKDFILEFGCFEDIPPDSLIFEVVDLFEETGSVREVPNPADHDIKEGIIEPQLVDVEFDVKDIKVEEQEIEFSEELIAHPLDEISQLEESFNKEEKTEEVEKESEGEENFWEDPDVDDVKEEISEQEPVDKKSKKKSKTKKERADLSTLTCDICRTKFMGTPGLTVHMKTQHFYKKTSCKLCGKTKKSVYDLRVHMREIHNHDLNVKIGKTFKCPVASCAKLYTYAYQVRNHMMKHSDVKTEVCDICGKVLKNAITMRAHLKTHSDERSYKCNYPSCERTYRTHGSLVMHRRSHTGEKPFVCQSCGKRFCSKNSVKIHQRQHTQENPFRCELCGKTTKQKSNLKSHMKHFHKIQNPH
ncbi:hypothetical protein DMENIID0001_041600 [Sergentomyia squamirostris]